MAVDTLVPHWGVSQAELNKPCMDELNRRMRSVMDSETLPSGPLWTPDSDSNEEATS